MDLAASVRRAASDLYANDLPHGWATHSLQRSMRRVVFFALAAWQMVMIWAAVNGAASQTSRTLLVLAHLLLAGALLVANTDRFQHRVSHGILHVLLWSMSVAHLAAADSIENVLAFTACWSSHISALTASFFLRARGALYEPLLMALLVPLSIPLLHPDWGSRMPLALGVATLSIIVATRFGLQVLIDFAGRADEMAVKAERESERSVAVRAASAEAAEDARTLHDTVINTLGAIVRGGAATADPSAVRNRCDHDADIIGELSTDERNEVGLADSIAAIACRGSQPITCTGMDRAAVEEMAEAHPEVPWSMLAGIVQELVQNATKHARSTMIGIDVARVGSDVLITVSDDGIGFDGSIPAGRGLDRSVLARARSAGVQVEMETAPGQGTTVTLRVRLVVPEDLDEAVDPGMDVEETIPRLHAQAGWLWAAGLTLVGLALSVLNHPGMWTEHYVMTGVAAVAAAYAWVRTRDGQVLPKDALIVLTSGACAAFLLSMLAIDFGRTEVVYGQALGPTAALVVLIAARRRPHDLTFALVVYLATVVTVTVLVWRTEPDAAATVQVSGLVPVWIGIGWAGFQRSIARIGARAAQDQRNGHAARLDAAARLSAEHARRRWRDAGLHNSEALLRKIAAGTSDPRSPEVRERCASEEAYLRQLVMLEPELVWMGEWFARALKVGYDRDVQVVLRSGQTDAPDPATAADLGELVLAVVEAVPTGSDVTVSLFRTSQGLQLMMVGPMPVREVASTHRLAATNLSLSSTTIGEQDIVTVIADAADDVAVRREPAGAVG